MSEERVVDERRSFAVGEGTYYIAAPTAVDIKKADWAYSKRYTEALVEGIVTSAEMTDILKRRGIIGPEYEQRAMELGEELNNSVMLLEEASSMEEKRELAIRVAEARDAMFNWNQRLNGPMNNTCEQVADDARLEQLTACMVENEDGTKVWDSCEDFLTDNTRKNLAVKAKFEVMLFLQGLESDFLDRTPEAVAMKEVEDEVRTKSKEAVEALVEMQKEAELEKQEKLDEQNKKAETVKKAKTASKTKGKKASPKKPKAKSTK